MGLDGWSLIGRLKRAVKKIRLLLNFDLNRWKVASMIGGSSSSNVRRRVSFNDRVAVGLRGFMEDSESDTDSNNDSRRLRRSYSSPYCEDDNIDKKADMFIANFYKQLKIERQISLELRYAQNHVLASPSP